MTELKTKKILIVDDEEDYREVLKDRLEIEGVKIGEADNAHDAFKLFEDSNYDIVLTDVRMFKGGGIELLKSIKQKSKNPQCPVILITGYADISQDEAMRLGAESIMNKPFDLNLLVEQLKEIFKNKK